MKDSAKVTFNPLRIFGFSLVMAYIIGEVFNTYYNLHKSINLIGIILLFLFLLIFYLSVKIFLVHKEKLPPSTPTYVIIKTGIYSYSRNPIYCSFVGFQFSMFMVFENITYLISSMALFFWIHYYVVLREEEYLLKKFGKKYERYKCNVPRWLFKKII